MCNTPDRLVLLTFAMMTDRTAAEAYFHTEIRKVTRRLHRIFDDYSKTDWPLLTIIMETYAAAVYELLPPEDRQLIDELRSLVGKLKKQKQEGGQ